MKEKPARQSTQLQVSEARKTRQQPMWLEREKSSCKTDWKNYALVICLFVFLFVIIGGACIWRLVARSLPLTGTRLAVFAFQSRFGQDSSHGNGGPTTAKNEVHYASNTTNKPDE